MKKQTRITLVKTFSFLHKTLLWISLFAFTTFIVSALTHPIMVWTGPQAKTFRPPAMVLQGGELQHHALPSLLTTSGIEQASVIKVVPTPSGNLLQISQDEKTPREYFDLTTGQHIDNFDTQQAQWLARHYTQLSEDQANIRQIDFITEFTHDYPWVNRLIPVYKVDFDTEDNLSVYVYTETNALAGVNNDWKRTLQSVFQMFHTWNWLHDYPSIRIAIILILLINVLIMLISGLVMLIKIRRRKYQSRSQRIHRQLAWVIFIPLLGFVISGIYHLLQYEYGDNLRGMRLGSAFEKENMLHVGALPTLDQRSLAPLQDLTFNSFSLIRYNQNYFYRASIAHQKSDIPMEPHSHHMPTKRASDHDLRNKRFDGINREKGALYIPISDSNHISTLDDETYSRDLALQYLGLTKENHTTLQKVTRFGPEYDFRNKRLPVWKVTVASKMGDRLFVDPATGILVDHLVDKQRYEGYSFSMLHKWNFLLMTMDRQSRDIVIVAFLSMMLALALLGFRLRSKKQAIKPNETSKGQPPLLPSQTT